MYAVIGLGNPGEKYTNTRHNVGRIVLDAFLQVHGFEPMEKDNGIRCESTWGEISGERVEIIYPDVYMNLSGESLKLIVEKRKILPERLIVIHDDAHLPFGTIRVSYGRGAGGHNGVASIIKALHTKDFIRIRIGVAQKGFLGGLKKYMRGNLSQFILKKFSAREVKQLGDVAEKVNNAIVHIIEHGVEHAMQECNA